MTNPPKFTREQEDWICFQVGEWYLKYKHRITFHTRGCAGCSCSEHYLGSAAQNLKDRLLNYLEIVCPECAWVQQVNPDKVTPPTEGSYGASTVECVNCNKIITFYNVI